MKAPLPDRDDFEVFLAAQPFRHPPAEWRESILATARQVRPTPLIGPRQNRTFPRLRHGWCALALIWLGLALMRLDTPAAPGYAGRDSRPTLTELAHQLARHQEEGIRLLALVTDPVRRGSPMRRSPLAHPPLPDASSSLPIP